MKTPVLWLLACALCTTAVLSTPASAQVVPNLVSYQGRVAVGTTNFEGTGSFKFVLTNSTGSATYWSNDGSSAAGSQPTNAVSLTVSKGLYSVLLGDTTLANMTAIPVSVWTNPDVRLRLWFSDGTNGFQQLAPDQRLSPTGYVADGAISAAALAANAVTAAKIGTGAVGSAQLAPNLSLGGSLTLPSTTASSGVIFSGSQTLLHSFGIQNIFLGAGAGNLTMTGAQNTATGYQALAADTSGGFNAAFGYQTLRSNLGGIYNTAVGYQALFSNTSGFSNTASGAAALQANTIGYQNTGVGDDALNANTAGVNNTASGYATLFLNQTGSNNTAAGFAALYSNTADNNTATGYSALYSNQSGTANVAVGYQPLYSNVSGADNIGIGNEALYSSTGTGNIGIGYKALSSRVSGDHNIAIGYLSGWANDNPTTGSNNIDIGYLTVAGSESGVIRIGQFGIQNKVFLQGITTDSIPSAPVYVGNDGQLVTFGSSARFKEDIEDMDQASEALLSLRPVSFHYKTQKPGNDGHRIGQFGLIAEEVAQVNPDLVLHDANGEMFTVRYDQVNAMLLNEFLKDHRRAREATAEIAGLKKRLADLEAKDRKREERLSSLEQSIPR